MKTRYTALQIALEAIGALLIVLMAVFVIVHWNTLPEAIPVHYDSHGDVDRWASRWDSEMATGISSGVSSQA